MNPLAYLKACATEMWNTNSWARVELVMVTCSSISARGVESPTEASLIVVRKRSWCLHGPSFERGDSEERQHRLTDVVEVELVVTPLSLAYSRRSVHVH